MEFAFEIIIVCCGIILSILIHKIERYYSNIMFITLLIIGCVYFYCRVSNKYIFMIDHWVSFVLGLNLYSLIIFLGNKNIELPGNMNQSLRRAIAIKNKGLTPLRSSITANAVEIEERCGKYEIRIVVAIDGKRTKIKTIAFAWAFEIMTNGAVDQSKVDKIANDAINIALNQRFETQNIDRGN
jgi:hypothetical protein